MSGILSSFSYMWIIFGINIGKPYMEHMGNNRWIHIYWGIETCWQLLLGNGMPKFGC